MVRDPFSTSTLGTGFDGAVSSVVPLDGGGYLVGGYFTAYQGVSVPRLVRLGAGLELDTAFNTALGTGFNGAVHSVVQLDDGGYLIGGAFNVYQGWLGVNRLARLNAGLELDLAFNAAMGTGFNGGVFPLVPLDDGGHLVGGSFITYQGVSANHLVRLGADLELDTDFNSALGAGFNNSVYSAVPLGDGSYIVGGNFSSFQGVSVSRLVRLVVVSVTVGPVVDQSSVAGVPLVAPVQVPVAVAPVGEAGSVTFSASGLPDGLSLDAGTGQVTGTATTPGSSTVTVSATSSGITDVTTFTWVVTVAPVAPILTGVPPAGVVGTGYDFVFGVGGTPAPTVAVTDGVLPEGLVLDADTGRVFGTPTASGLFEFTVSASNGVDPVAVLRTSITITDALSVVSLSVEHAQRLAGEVQSVHGTGFAPGAEVRFVMASDPVDLGAVVADESGAVSLTFTVPAGTAPGVHTITATSGLDTATATFSVVADHEPGSGTGEGGTLAESGAHTGLLAAITLSLLTVGAVLLTAARRRQQN